MRTFGTHSTVIIGERTAERGKVFALDAGIWVETLGVDAMLGCGMVGNLWVGTMAA